MNWVKQLFSRRRFYHDLSDEIQEHLEEKVEELIAEGNAALRSRPCARRQFGNVALTKEQDREVWTWPWTENRLADLSFVL